MTKFDFNLDTSFVKLRSNINLVFLKDFSTGKLF